MKQNKLFEEVIGNEVKKWTASHYKYKSLKLLAKGLEITPSDLSRYLSGAREMPGRIMDRLIQLGFPQDIVTRYYSKTFETKIPESLTKDDLIKLIIEYQKLLAEYKDLYYKTVDRIVRYQKSAEKESETISILVKRLERMEISK